VILQWTVEPTAAKCAACRRTTTGTVVARREMANSALEVVTCDECGSLTIRGGAPGATEPDHVDAYIEYEADVETLLRNLFRQPDGAVRSVLDIGGRFGFALAFATHIAQWQAVGIDPGDAARRGAVELGLDIHHEAFTPTTDLGRVFDLVVVPGVLEKSDDPLGFLVAARRHVAPGGRLVVTTPDAREVTPRHPTSTQAIGTGSHLVLFSRAALEANLREAGFERVRITEEDGLLVACATVDDAVDPAVTGNGPSASQVDAFHARLATLDTASSSLRLGAASRRYAAAAARGMWDGIEQLEAAAFDAYRERYGGDLTAPRDLAVGDGAGPLLLVAHAAALSRLARDLDSPAALDYVDLGIRAAAVLATSEQGIGLRSRDLCDLLVRHRPIAVARVDPERAPREAEALVEAIGADEAAEWVTRAFCELAIRGNLADADRVALDAAVGIGTLPRDARGIRIAMDAARGLALTALRAGDGWVARGWIGFEEDLLTERSAGVLEPAEVESRRVDIRGVRAAAMALPDSVAASGSPSIAPVDEAQLWGEYPPGAGDQSISVVLALHNGGDLARRAVLSVAAQSLRPLELIVVDDGSIDGSAALIETLNLPFPLRVIRRPNGGQSSARNVGIRQARGSAIAFLDQDDEWRPQHLEVLSKRLSADDDLGWVFADFDAIDADGRTIVRHFVSDTRVHHPRRSIAGMISSDLMALPSASLIRRKALYSVRGFDRRLIGYEDDDLFVRLFRRGWTYDHVPESTVRYRMHAGGASRSTAFLRSRLVYFETLLRAVPDDHRLGLYLSSAIIPRFFQVTMREYSEALAFRDFDRAREIAKALERISSLDAPHRSRWRRRWELRLIQRPERMRRVLGLVESLPPRLRPRINPDLSLAATSLGRARQLG
jgi:glycosyltransferase involved in cell wall biosynthesis